MREGEEDFASLLPCAVTNSLAGTQMTAGLARPFFSSLRLFSSASRAALSPLFPELLGKTVLGFALGCSSGIEILLRWIVRLVGGEYLESVCVLSLSRVSFKLIRLGPFWIGAAS